MKITSNILSAVLITQSLLQPLSYARAETIDQKIALMKASPEAASALQVATDQFGEKSIQRALTNRFEF